MGSGLSGQTSTRRRPDQGRRDDEGDRPRADQAATRHRLPETQGVEILLDEPAPARRRHASSATTTSTPRSSQQASARPEASGSKRPSTRSRRRSSRSATALPFDAERTDDFPMRPEQEEAVALTAGYFRAHAGDGHQRRSSCGTPRCGSARHSPTYQLAARWAGSACWS